LLVLLLDAGINDPLNQLGDAQVCNNQGW